MLAGVAQVSGHIPAGRVVASLPLADVHESNSGYTATLELRDSGDLVLHWVSSGYPVMVQIAEDCTSLESWHTVAAADVPRLGTDTTNLLESVRDAASIEGGWDAHTRFDAWLRELGVSRSWGERINYYDDTY
jgi:hypothetical protein